MEVVYSPFGSDANAYVNIVMSGLRACGCDVLDMDELYGRKSKKPIPVILNWEDEVSGKNPFRVLLRFLKKAFRLHRIRFNGGRFVYVIHNRAPHDATGIALPLSRGLRRHLAVSARSIVVLCDETRHVLRQQLGAKTYAAIEPKIMKIPHPTYTGYYPRSGKDWRAKYGIGADKFLFVFSGLVRPYKGIELIFEVAEYFRMRGYDAEFLVAGRCLDPEYEKAVASRAAGVGNVHISLGFVKDDELGELVEASDAYLLPMDINSSLNSGSCFLAFSYGRTVVCPLIGTLKEFDRELFYSYEYETLAEHKDKIIAAAERAYLDWKNDPSAFANKGQRLKSIVDTEGSVEAIGSLYIAAAEKCLKEI